MIRIKREGPREPSPDFKRKIRDYNRTYGSPEVAVVWNSMSVDLGYERWDPRWEIWIEVTDNTLQRKTVKSEADREFEGKTWRFLNTWQYPEDKSYAALDDRVFPAFREVDTWRHREIYQEIIEKPEQHQREREFKVLKDIAYGVRDNLSRR